MFVYPGVANAKEEINSKFRKGLELVDCELNMGTELLRTLPSELSSERALYVAIQVGFFISGFRAFYAIKILCEHGLAQDQATILLRTLSEITANSIRLSQGDIVKNAERFRDFALIDDLRLYENASELAATEELKKQWEEILSQRREVVADIKDRNGEEGFKELRKSNSWITRHIYLLFEMVGMTDQYKTIYKKGSTIGHGRNVEDWIRISGSSTIITFDPRASSNSAGEVLCYASTFFFNLLNVMDETIEASLHEEIRVRAVESEKYWQEKLVR